MSATPIVPAVPRMADAMALLARGVPLSLLFDLVLGPRSRELLDVERLTAAVPVQSFGSRTPTVHLLPTG